MPVSTTRTHYAVLGVPPGAGPEEIRRAHRQLARVLHPDRQAGSTDAERRLAERRMREVNAAWTVLSEPGRRAAYDASLASATAARPGTRGRPTSPTAGAPSDASDSGDPDDLWEGSRGVEVDPDEPPLPAWQFWMLRRGPVVAAVVVAAMLFVLTAYAGGGGGGTDPGAAPSTSVAQDCVRVTEGRNAVRSSCAAANDGRIVTGVARALDCPSGTSYVVLDGSFACVTSNPALRSNVVPGEGRP